MEKGKPKLQDNNQKNMELTYHSIGTDPYNVNEIGDVIHLK